MSNVGQGVLTIAGTVIGAMFGAPQLGYLIGSLAGQALFPTQLPGVQGPKLADLRTTTSQVGGPVMEVLGVDAVPGTVMWLGPVREVASREDTGGKGGPEQTVTNFTYFQPIALGLCRGPMGGVFKIFENGKLVYDASPQQDDETEAAYQARATAAGAYAETFTLYLGDEAQMPDPTIESVEGVGNVPGFRGLMYIVFHSRQLRVDQGMRHPNFKFVVYQSGATECETITEYSNYLMFPWMDADDPINPANLHTYHLASVGFSPDIEGDPPNGAADFDTMGEALSSMASQRGVSMGQYLGFGVDRPGAPDGELLSYTNQMGAPGPGDAYQVNMFYNWVGPDETIVLHGSVLDTMTYVGAIEDSGIKVATNFGGFQSHHAVYVWVSDLSVAPPVFPWNSYAISDGSGGGLWQSGSGMVVVNREPRAPINPCNGKPPYPGAPGYCIIDGYIVQGSEWSHDVGAYNVLRDIGSDAGHVILPLNPALPVGHEDDNEEFWENAYNGAVIQGDMVPGLEYGIDYPVQINQAFFRTYEICAADPEGITLDKVVRHICLRCGLTDSQIDVTDLDETWIVGYTISRVMNGRDAIEPLRLVGYFDVVESGDVLKFVKRGKPAVRTIGAEELGAFESGGTMGPAVTTRMQQDTDLPRQLRLHYRAASRDFEEGEQLSPTRLITTAVNDVDVECPIAITDQMAAEAAEVNWADPWAGRWVHQLNLDRAHLELEPSDCILVPIDDRLERLRILAIDDQLPMLRKIEAVRDDDGSYVSVAIGSTPARPPATMVIYAGTTLFLLDLPALRDEDDDAGIYIAATRTGTVGTWSGAMIFRSTDNGASYDSLGAVSSTATTVTLLEELPAGLTTVWDDENTITVTLDTGTLESRTDADVLTGVNTLALGADDRWELIQFGTATQIGPTTWELSHLLRGRRGTEHLMGTQEVGDRGVLVSGSGILRAGLNNALVDTPVLYRGVTNGAPTNGASDIEFTSEGVALLPFSPVHIEAERVGNDVALTWLRRNRLGQELQGGEIPMSETTLAFVLEFFTPAGTTPLRTVAVSAETYTYTSAQQIADLGDDDEPFRVEISQVSAVVGRGTPASLTVDV